MNLAIAWTDEAQETFDHTITQIENKWGLSSAEKFVREAHKKINTISTQPYLFSASYTSNIRKRLLQGKLLYFTKSMLPT